MPHTSPRSRKTPQQAARGPRGLKTWTAIAVILAALVTGLLVTMMVGGIGTAYVVCFALGALIAVLCVEFRGLFLTVTSIPILFALLTVVTGWFTSRADSPDGAAPFSRTMIVTSIFPIIQLFPALIGTTLAALAIAIIRFWLGRRNSKSQSHKAQVARRAEAEADRRNRDSTAKARQQSSKLSVADLVARNEKEKTQPGAAARTAGTSASRGRIPSRDREQRRREQAAEREAAAQRRIERGRALRDNADRSSAQRLSQARAERERREAEQTQKAESYRKRSERTERLSRVEGQRLRPDPTRRAGQQPHTESFEPVVDNPKTTKPDASNRWRRLDEDLYSED